ncbi:NAD(P)H-dependent oxidoreductase [Clostridium faecium]
MRILIIIDDSNKEDIGSNLQKKLAYKLQERNYNCKNYNIENSQLSHCIGCFKCWINTPGICIHDDLARKINSSIMWSDICILITEIKYGCYSPNIKRVLDRSIGNILPFFKMINGEMHHAPRYDKYPQLVMIGYGKEITSEEENTFQDLNRANAINFQKNMAKTYICRNIEDIDKIINNFIEFLENIGGDK